MTGADFDTLVTQRMAHCLQILTGKEQEYARGDDRLHNFKRAAAFDNDTPERALWGMWKKHIVSVADMIDDIEHGKLPSQERVDEKLTDMINYTLLLEGLLLERMCVGYASPKVSSG
jgi:hypothetical protein